MTTYQNLQDIHQQLLARREAGEDRMALRQSVRDYIEQARRQAGDVVRPRDRDQLRANLRFWATYLYDETGTYPDTTLVPANQPASVEEPAHPVTKSWTDVVDLPGPIDLPRWALGLGVTIIVLLTILIVFMIPQSGSIGTAEATREQMLGLQSTQISVVSTVMSQPSPTPVDWRDIAELIPVPETPIPSMTPDLTETMSALRTQVVQTQPTPTKPTITPSMLPETGGGDKAYLRPALMATVQVFPNSEGCGETALQVKFNLALDALSPETLTETIQAFTPQDFALIIAPIGETGRRTAPLNVNADGVARLSGSITANTAYLVQLVDARVTASDVIVPFDAQCSQRYAITYAWQERPSLLPKEPVYDERLTLAWNVLAWGPVPQISPGDASPWFATLDLAASGGDGTYLYWLYNYGSFEPLSGNQVTLYADDCLPVNAVVGVTSGGLTVVRELVLLSPLCPAPTGDVTPEVACSAQAEVLQNAICRTGPGTIYDVVTAYKAGQLLTPEGRNADTSWLWVLMLDSQRHCWVSAALLSPPCDMNALPTIAAPPTPTGAPTLTSTPSPTVTSSTLRKITPTLTSTPQPSVPQISGVAASNDEFYYQADTCSPDSLTLQLKASDINGVSGVTVFYRLTDAFTFNNTAWYSLALTATDNENWAVTIYPEKNIPDVADYISATFEYYFEAINTQNVSISSATYRDVTLFRCE